MTPETVNVGAELAALNFYLSQAQARGDDWAVVLAAIPGHPAAVTATALETACEECGAAVREPCRPDCTGLASHDLEREDER